MITLEVTFCGYTLPAPLAAKQNAVGKTPKTRYFLKYRNLREDPPKDDQLYLRINSRAPVVYLNKFLTLNLMQVDTQRNIVFFPLSLFEISARDIRSEFEVGYTDPGGVVKETEEMNELQFADRISLTPVSNAFKDVLLAFRKQLSAHGESEKILSGQIDKLKEIVKASRVEEEFAFGQFLLGVYHFNAFQFSESVEYISKAARKDALAGFIQRMQNFITRNADQLKKLQDG